MNSPKRLARTAGLFYLMVVVFGVFAHLFVRASIHVPGDASATAANIASNATLFRFGFVADLAMATSFLFVAFALFLLLKHVNAGVARAMVIFVALSVAIICLNTLNHVAALVVIGNGAYATAFGSGGTDALALLLLDIHGQGYKIAQLFFGLWLLPLGYLVYRSGMFPRALGVALMVACFGHLTEMLTAFLAPGFADTVSMIVGVPVIVAEFWMVGYLLVIGVRSRRVSAPLPAAA
jgi:hypothetical protein